MSLAVATAWLLLLCGAALTALPPLLRDPAERIQRLDRKAFNCLCGPIWGVVVDNTDIRLDSAKGNAINLSADILDFVVRRNQYERPIGRGQRLCPSADIVTD